MRTGIRKRKRAEAARELRDNVERQLSLAANMGRSKHEDPLYHVTETFHQSFRRIGQSRSSEQEEPTETDEASEEKREEQPKREGQQEKSGEEKGKGKGREERPPETEQRIGAAPVREFSKMAFARGELSAAVLQGTSKMALISCLKRSAGQPQQGKTLFGLGAQTSNVPARDPDQMMFHRNFAKSAVGLVVDTLRDARQTVDSLMEMATGGGNLRAEDGGVTLQTMYPFLDDSRERALLEERRTLLKGECTTEERAILENAAVRAEALIAKKARMKEEFIQKLREVSERATEALEELERPETLEEAAQALSETEAPNPPPDKREPSAPDAESASETERVGASGTESAEETETPSGVSDAADAESVEETEASGAAESETA